MKEHFCRYILNLYHNVPEVWYWGFLGVFCLGCILSFLIYGVNRGWKIASRLLLTEYVAIIYLVTVFLREELAVQKFKLMPFWSYRAFIEEGDEFMLIENIVNTLVFIPVGVLLGMSFDKIKPKMVFLLI